MTVPLRARLGDPRVRYPVAALNLDLVRHNVTEMDRYCREQSVLIAPHAKTTLVPEVLELQVAMPTTWGLTVADAAQARVAHKAGAVRILIANQLMERDDIAWLARRTVEGLTILSFVDSVEGVRLLDTALASTWPRGSASVRHPVLIEVGFPGGRCGTRTWDGFHAVADAVRSSRRLALRGVSGYEGLLAGASAAADTDRVDSYLNRLGEAAIRLADGWGIRGPEAILSAGGSTHFDRVVATCRQVAGFIGGQLLLRSGCYAIHDHGHYARTFPGARAQRCPDLRPAATVWARIQSRPDAARAVAAVGKRNLPHDAGGPTPLGVRYRDGIPGPIPPQCRTAALSDQHLHLDIPPDADLNVGDVLPLGISHPCGLFDRWRRMAVIDDGRNVAGAVTPEF